MKHQLSKKKIVIFFVILGVLAVGFIVAKSLLSAAGSVKKTAEADTSRTVTVELGTLEDAVTIKGTVKSAVSSSVSATVQGKITDLRVKEGDVVKKGDIIAILDDSDIKASIASKKREIASAKADLKQAFDHLTKQQEAEGGHKDQIVQEQNDLVDRARAAADEAASACSQYVSSYQQARAAYEQAGRDIQSKDQALQQADSARQKAYQDWVAAGQPASPDPWYAAYDAAEKTFDTAKDELATAKATFGYDAKAAAYDQAKTKMDALNGSSDSAAAAYSAALNTRTSVLYAEEQTIANLNQSAADARRKYEEYTGAAELEELNKKLEATVIRAETDGKITELKAKIGAMSKDEIATIQAVNQLIVETSVQPADVTRLQLNQKAVIQADTAAAEISGRVISISPTAVSQTSSLGTSAGTSESSVFIVQIEIEKPDSVYIGTSVTGRIITAQKQNVYAVPTEAVLKDDQGSHIKVRQTDGSFKDTLVETGDANEYNTEIKGPNVHAGMQVLAVYDYDALKPNTSSSVEVGAQEQ